MDERIVVICGYDSKNLCTKALEVISFVDRELGFHVQNSVLRTTRKVYNSAWSLGVKVKF